MVERLMESPAVEAVGWSLIAFVWQGALVGALAALLLWSLAGVDPRWRYATACLGLLVMTALPLRTAILEYEARARVPQVAAAIALPEAGGSEAATGSVRTSATLLPARTEASGDIAIRETSYGLGALAALWLAGVTLLSLRLAGGWLLLLRLRRESVETGQAIQGAVRTLARRLNVIPRVQVRGSGLVDVPTVLGWSRPLILVPAGAVAGLTPLELEAVLAHELAHVRRHDYGVNMLQRVSETLLFYHPAVWWLSERIRDEREMCADDLAVAACGDRALYARALRNLERSRTPRLLGLAATGGSLGVRVRRLLAPASAPDRWSPLWTGALLGTLALGAAVMATPGDTRAAVPAVQPPQEAPPAPEASGEAPAEDRVIPPLPAAEPAPEPAPLPAPAGPGVVALAVTRPVPTPGQEGIRPLPPTPAPSPVLENIRVVAPAGGQAVGQILSPAQDAAWLGLSVDDGEDQGAVVRAVEPDSPAADAGIEVGDLLTGLDGARVVGSRQFARIIGETPVGRTVRLTVIRDGQPRELSVTLAARPEPFSFYPIAPADEAVRYFGYNNLFSRISSPDLRLGLRVQEMTPELRTFFGAEPDRGVLVATVVEGSSADESGILVGDVIVAVAGRAIGTPGDLSWSGELVDDRLVLEIVREGVSREISVPLDLPPRSLRIGP